MKKRIPIFLLFKSLGLSKKKIIMSIKNPEFFEKVIQIKNISTQRSLLRLNEIIIDKESNLVRIY
jgi:hypothetical protein